MKIDQYLTEFSCQKIKQNLNMNLAKHLMIFCLFLPHALSISIGIDTGSAYTKSSIVDGFDSIEIGKNCMNHELTPTFIGFRAKPRFNTKGQKYVTADETQYLTPEIGEKALNIMQVRPNMGAGYFPDLIELNETYKKERAELLLTGLNASRVEFHDISALFYKMYLDCISQNKKVHDIVMVVPAKMLFLQRYQYEMIIRFSGYNKLHIVDDADVMSILYANEKSTKFSRSPKTVLFIDLGATSVKAYLIKFSNELTSSGHSTYPLAQRLSYSIDYNTGGVFITKAICEHMENKMKFKAKSLGEKRRLFDACERLKKLLSDENEAIVIANEIEGIDRTLHLTRNELNTIISPFITEALNVARNATHGMAFDEIEVIGGSSKIPKFVDSLRIGLSASSIGQSFDPEHALTKGAGYLLQFITEISKYPNVQISEPHSIFNISLLTMSESFNVCNLGKECKKSLQIPGNSSAILFDIDANEARPGLAQYSYGFFIDVVEGPISLTFMHHPFGLYNIEHCNSTGCHQMSLQLLMNPEGPTRIFEMFISEEYRQERVEEIKKKIRSLSEKVLADVQKNHTFRFFSNYTQRLEIIRCAESAKKWLNDNEFRDGVSPSNFTEQIDILEKTINPVYERIAANSSLVKAANMFLRTLSMAKNGSTIEWPETKPFLDKRTLTRYNELVQEMEEWFNETVAIVRKSPPYLERPIKPSAYDDRAMKLFDWYRIVDAIERKKKRTGRKLSPTPSPIPSQNNENDDDASDFDDDDEKHSSEYEYVEMNDEEMEAYYAENEWVDPFIEKKQEKPKTIQEGIENFRLTREMRHYINKKAKELDEAEKRQKAAQAGNSKENQQEDKNEESSQSPKLDEFHIESDDL
ncbi:hypothetical protein TRFO_32856 [Tritrichomonas foetus]|uniref:DnaK protein n=1 Tax=Tritrichomonas foetus TaxID=1144522 RepID=A0A1J4JN00_9EUKA|nr:hypothetical protein TRFO_32856 [Tritrichomonas foetus]|eukprot:OHT00451.1 hypothetical protein TRFO_32856 [Tritrichomonas foetus]